MAAASASKCRQSIVCSPSSRERETPYDGDHEGGGRYVVKPRQRMSDWAATMTACTLGLTLACGAEEVFDPTSIPIPSPDLSQVTEQTLVGAVESAKAAVAASRRSATAWGWLGHTYLVHDWETMAVPCYETAAALEPDEFHWHYYLGKSLERSDPQAALDAFDRASTLTEGYAPLYAAQAKMLRRMGHLDEARERLEQAAKLAPRSPAIELALGQVDLSAGLFEPAQGHLGRALELNPGLSEAHQALAQVRWALGDEPAARRHAEAAKRPTVRIRLPDPLWDKTLEAGATKFWFARRADRYLKARDYGRAAIEYAKAATDDEPNPMFWYNYGNALRNTGSFERAIEMYGRAAKAARKGVYATTLPDFKRIRIYNNLGLAYAQLGDLASAEEQWVKALAIDPALATETVNNLAIIYQQQGRLSDALALLETTPGVDRNPRLAALLRQLRVSLMM